LGVGRLRGVGGFGRVGALDAWGLWRLGGFGGLGALEAVDAWGRMLLIEH
jgi:hypothetical protein